MVSRAPAAPRALLVEDDPAVRDLLAEVLAEAGYRVLPVDHAPDPVDVAHLRPDLVLLDLVLGGREEGWELLLGLRAQAGTARLPVVVCTAAHALARREADRLRELGAAVVLKPFDLDELLSRVAACRSGGTGDGLAPTAPGACDDPRAGLRGALAPWAGEEAEAMRYDVTYLLADEERTDRVEARDAALAVEAVEAAHGPALDRFELLAVSLLDPSATARPGGGRGIDGAEDAAGAGAG